MQFTVKVEWLREDGSIAGAEVGSVDIGVCQSAADVGLKLADGKRLFSRLQEIVVAEQLHRHRPRSLRVASAQLHYEPRRLPQCCRVNFSLE